MSSYPSKVVISKCESESISLKVVVDDTDRYEFFVFSLQFFPTFPQQLHSSVVLSLLNCFLKRVFESKLNCLLVVFTVLAFKLGLNPVHINVAQVLRSVDAAETQNDGELDKQDDRVHHHLIRSHISLGNVWDSERNRGA